MMAGGYSTFTQVANNSLITICIFMLYRLHLNAERTYQVTYQVVCPNSTLVSNAHILNAHILNAHILNTHILMHILMHIRILPETTRNRRLLFVFIREEKLAYACTTGMCRYLLVMCLSTVCHLTGYVSCLKFILYTH